MKAASPQRWFLLACLFELALLGIAALTGWLLRQPLWSGFCCNLRDSITGALAALPLFACFLVLLRSSWKPLVGVRDFLEAVVHPIFGRWSSLQLAVVSVLAGVGEESLFRGVVQGGLTSVVGAAWALGLASVLFGLCHSVTPAYALMATVIGGYLGVLWWATGNLLTPVMAHALYDFAALAYFVRLWRPCHDTKDSTNA